MVTVPVSTVPAVKAYLLTALRARSELSTLVAAGTLQYGPPTTFLDDDLILLAGATGTFAPLAMVGGGGQYAREETYSLEVQVWSFRGDDDPQATEERAFTLGAVVIDTVRQDPSLGGLVVEAWPTGFELDPNWDDDHLGRHARYVLQLAVDATQ